MSARVLAWRARRIGDPVERLRYLRGTAAPRLHRRAWPKTPCWAALLLLGAARTVSDTPDTRYMGRSAEPPERYPHVWLVETSAGVELYSNGLRVEDRSTGGGRRRNFVAFTRDPNLTQQRLAEPAGIVFHTSESPQPPFEPHHTLELKQRGQDLLIYVSSRRLYHFLIDRFGRVYRTVPETDFAGHAGASVWADARRLYLDLSEGFLGVSFEARTQLDGALPITPAQVHAGSLLVAMLRARYRIPAGNCVTHAQVSVNPRNLQIGYHTDWADAFPFTAIGLPYNYAQPLPSVTAFGFDYDHVFFKSTGLPLWKAAIAAEQQLREEAAALSMPAARYRELLRARHRALSAALQAAGGQEVYSYAGK